MPSETVFVETLFTKAYLDNISSKQLSAKCIIQISKFARALYQINGSVLNVKDDKIIEKIALISNKLVNKKLQTIYTQIQLEILDITCESTLNRMPN